MALGSGGKGAGAGAVAVIIASTVCGCMRRSCPGAGAA
jgi:hypothetical protein